MKRFFLRFLICLLFFNMLYANNIKEGTSINFGFYTNSTLISNNKDIRIAIELWIKEIMYSSGIDINLRIYDNIDLMMDDFLYHKKLQMLGFEPIDFIKNRHKLVKKYQKLWTFQVSKDKYIQYYFIEKKKEKNYKFNLNNKNIAIKKGDLSAKIWLDMLSIENFKQPYKKVIQSETLVEKQSSAILKVYFEKLDCAVVSKDTFDVMKELNPNIVHKLDIIKKSPKIFLSYIGLLSKNLSKQSANKLEKSMNMINHSSKGRQILDLLKVEKILILEEEFFQKLEIFYKNYENTLKSQP